MDQVTTIKFRAFVELLTLMSSVFTDLIRKKLHFTVAEQNPSKVIVHFSMK